MWGYQSLGSWSLKTSHPYARPCNDSEKSSEQEGVELSSGEENFGHMSLETSLSSSINPGSRESREKYVSRDHPLYLS